MAGVATGSMGEEGMPRVAKGNSEEAPMEVGWGGHTKWEDDRYRSAEDEGEDDKLHRELHAESRVVAEGR